VKVAKMSVVLLVALLLAGMLALPATAQEESLDGDGYPLPVPPEEVEVEDVVIVVEEEEAPPAPAPAPEAAVLGRVLAVTGGDVIALALGGVAVLLAGLGLVVSTRRRRRTTAAG
jgi:LPXTG-motif cell wall-anchored protein